jgi:hypothetical protein
MAASAFSRLYRKVMARVLEPLGFQRKWSEFWRERDDVLYVIALHRGDEDFTVDVAVQPLVVPYETSPLPWGHGCISLVQAFPPGGKFQTTNRKWSKCWKNVRDR